MKQETINGAIKALKQSYINYPDWRQTTKGLLCELLRERTKIIHVENERVNSTSETFSP